jgi:hypothetical protein
MNTKAPLTVGDRIWVTGINVSPTHTPVLVDAVVPVVRVTDQSCGCWRVECDRPQVPGSRIALYGADCRWPHEDRIDYAAALAEAVSRAGGPGRRARRPGQTAPPAC